MHRTAHELGRAHPLFLRNILALFLHLRLPLLGPDVAEQASDLLVGEAVLPNYKSDGSVEIVCGQVQKRRTTLCECGGRESEGECSIRMVVGAHDISVVKGRLYHFG